MTDSGPDDDSTDDAPEPRSFNRSLSTAIGLMQIGVGAYLIYLPFGLGDPGQQAILIALGVGSILLGIRKLYVSVRG